MPVGECGSPIRNAMCSMLTGVLDTAISRVQQARNVVRAQVREIERGLNGLVPAVPQDIQDALDAIYGFQVPQINAIDNLKCMATFIEGCSYLRNSPFGNVAAITNRLADYFNQNLQADLKSLLPDLYEFDISWNMSLSMDFTSALGLDIAVQEFNQVTQCMTAFCNVDIQEKIDTMTTTLSDMSLSVDGTLDYETIMNRTGIAPTSRDAVRNLLSAINIKKAEISDVMTAGVESTMGMDYSYLVTEHLFESEDDFEIVVTGAHLHKSNREILASDTTSLNIITTTVFATTLTNKIELISTASFNSTSSGNILTGTNEILTSTSITSLSTSASIIYTKLALGINCSVNSVVEPRLTVT